MNDNKMKVTLDSIVLGLQPFGGVSNYWCRLIKFLDQSDEINSHIILPKSIKTVEYSKEFHTRSSRQTEMLPVKVSRYLDVKDKNSSDIFHTSYFRAPLSRSSKNVVTVYDFIYERYGTGLSRKVHSWQKKRSIHLADAVLCISQATRNDVLKYYPNINPSKVHVTYLGVDRNNFFPNPLENKADFENVVLFIGNRVPHKRFDLAVKALIENQELILGIVGPPLEVEEVAFLDSQIGNRWRYLSRVSLSGLRQLYSSVFAFIYPSDYEGFGLPILEAMACGCPVITANTSSLPEVGGSAALYALEQTSDFYSKALQQLFNSSSIRQNKIIEGFAQIQNFTWENTFEKTISIYSSL